MKRIARKRPHYVSRVLASAQQAIATMRVLPGALEVDVYHDDGCPILTGRGECTCDADVGDVHQLLAPTEVQ